MTVSSEVISQRVEIVFVAAKAAHQAGRVEEALAGYHEVLRLDPHCAGAWHLLGVARQQQDCPEEAVTHIRRAIELAGPKGVYLNNLGVALRALGRLDEALEAFRHALLLRPAYADALANVGLVLAELGHEAETEPLLLEALTREPAHIEAVGHLATLLDRQGRGEEAIRLLKGAIQRRPEPKFYHQLGNLLVAIHREEEAADAYQQALVRKPDYAEVCFNLGTVWHERGCLPEARQHFEQAARLRPDKPLWRLWSSLLFPAVFGSAREIDTFRRSLPATLDAHREAAQGASWEDVFESGIYPHTTLAYHGRDDRAIKMQFAAQYEPVFRNMPPPPGSGLHDRRRVGFVVTRGHEGIFLLALSGVLERLDGERFEWLIFCSSQATGVIRARLPRLDLRLVPLPPDLRRAVEVVRREQCDVLYYWEIGTDPLNYFLPFTRPAPVQCISCGWPVTSGIPAVDYMLSSRWIEDPEAQSYYTERLWLGNSLLMYRSRLEPAPPVSKSHFGLPEDCRLYVCLQNPLKLHPDFDLILAEILAADPKGLVLLSSGSSPHLKQLLQHRFAQQMPAAASRIIFVPRVTDDDYRGLLQLADVVLDPLHYGAGSSCHDVFSLNQPMVTLPGAHYVSRVAAGYYRKMGVTDLIASSPEHYVRLALQVAHDHDFRSYVKAHIFESSASVFDDSETVHDHERFFEMAVEAARG